MQPVLSSAVCSEQLYTRNDLWRRRMTRPQQDAQSTGFDDLDKILHGGGWPASGLMELLCVPSCSQALRLLLPTLASRQDGLLVMANPPARPQASVLRQAGIHSGNLLVLRTETPATLLRACREAAASGVASTLVAWLPAGTDTPGNLRRLHLAALQGRCLLIVLRHADQALQPSPAPLRAVMRVAPPAHLDIEIIKQPGRWGGQRLKLSLLPERPGWPLAERTAMPAPPSQRAAPQPLFRDPDSRFGHRAAVPPVTSGQTLSLPW